MSMNPFCENALEEAVKLKARETVLTATATLQRTLAIACDFPYYSMD